jgi:hypothetical protein
MWLLKLRLTLFIQRLRKKVQNMQPLFVKIIIRDTN